MNQVIVPMAFDVPYCHRCSAHIEAGRPSLLGGLFGGKKRLSEAQALTSGDCSTVGNVATVREEKSFGGSYSSSTDFWHIFTFSSDKFAELFCGLNEGAEILKSDSDKSG